jgi:hypothetical protein
MTNWMKRRIRRSRARCRRGSVAHKQKPRSLREEESGPRPPAKSILNHDAQPPAIPYELVQD